MESTTFLDNSEVERSFANLFEEALYAACSPEEKKQIKDAKEKAKNSIDFTDAVNNPLQQLGSGTQDLTTKGLNFFSRRNLSWQIPKQDAIMRDIPYFDKASSWKATKALKYGIDLKSKKHSSDELNDVKTSLHDLYFALHKIVKLGDFNGASAGLMFFDDCKDDEDWAKPLNINKIKKGSFNGIRPLTRFFQIVPKLDDVLVQEVDKENGIYDGSEIGKPMYYHVNISGDRAAKTKWFKVHRSRVLWYTSIELTYVEERIELYGGPSLLERTYTDFSRYESFVAQLNKLAQRSNIPILNMKGLPQAALNNQSFVDRVMAKIKAINYSASVGNMILLGDKNQEEFKFETAQFNGLIDIAKHLRENLASALEAPTKVLFNDVNGTDEENHLTKVSEIQDGIIRLWYNVLIPVLYKNEFGKKIQDFSYTFKPLDDTTEKDKADTFKQVVESLHILYEDEAIDVESYQMMLKAGSENISDIPHEITSDYVKFVQKEGAKGEPLTKKRRDIEVAIALNHLQENAGENGGKTPNPIESAEKGKEEGGKQSKKKPTAEIKISSKKE